MNYKLLMESWREFISEQMDMELVDDLAMPKNRVRKKKPMKGIRHQRTRGSARSSRTTGVQIKRKKRRLRRSKFRLKSYSRIVRPVEKIRCIVIHESGTPTLMGLIATLNHKNLSVNWSITKGKVDELVPSEHATWHAPGSNLASIGIEVNHNYYKGKNGEKAIHAPWHGADRPSGKYGVPALDTLEATYNLVNSLCDKYGIEKEFYMVKGNKFMLTRRKLPASNSLKGIIAHGSFQNNRADGVFPCLYMVLRNLGYPPSTARMFAIELMTGKYVKKDKFIQIPAPGTVNVADDEPNSENIPVADDERNPGMINPEDIPGAP